MNNIGNKATKGCQETITVDELKEELGNFLDFHELNHYNITENLSIGVLTYNLYNLDVEMENTDSGRAIWFNDLEHVIKQDNTRTLNMIYEDCIITVNRKWYKDENWKATLVFQNESIEIERLKK